MNSFNPMTGKKDLDQKPQICAYPSNPCNLCSLRFDDSVQRELGIIIGKIIAHEIRHQYIQPHADSGLGFATPGQDMRSKVWF